MAKYYDLAVGRWEGEGGALKGFGPATTPTGRHDIQKNLSADLWFWRRQTGSVRLVQLISSIVLLAGFIVYARRKEWI